MHYERAAAPRASAKRKRDVFRFVCRRHGRDDVSEEPDSTYPEAIEQNAGGMIAIANEAEVEEVPEEIEDVDEHDEAENDGTSSEEEVRSKPLQRRARPGTARTMSYPWPRKEPSGHTQRPPAQYPARTYQEHPAASECRSIQ